MLVFAVDAGSPPVHVHAAKIDRFGRCGECVLPPFSRLLLPVACPCLRRGLPQPCLSRQGVRATSRILFILNVMAAD